MLKVLLTRVFDFFQMNQKFCLTIGAQFRHKGFFLVCVPEKYIMLIKNVWIIHIVIFILKQDYYKYF